MARVAAALAALILLVSTGELARAEPDEAEALFQRGTREFGRGRYAAALRTFEAAGQKSTEPRQLGRIFLFIGFAHAILGDRGEAQRSLTVALDHDADLVPEQRRFKQELLDLFEEVRRGLALLSVEVRGGEAAVLVDGNEKGTAPVRAFVPPGPHLVQVRWRERTQSSRVVVTAGQRLALSFDFGARPETAPAQALAGGATDEARPSFWQRRRVWTWVALGAAVAAGATALGLGVAASKKHDEWQAALASYKESNGTSVRRSEVAALADSVRSRQLGANICFGLTGGLVVTSVVLLLLEGRPPSTPVRAGLFPGGLSLQGQF